MIKLRKNEGDIVKKKYWIILSVIILLIYTILYFFFFKEKSANSVVNGNLRIFTLDDKFVDNSRISVDANQRIRIKIKTEITDVLPVNYGMFYNILSGNEKSKTIDIYSIEQKLYDAISGTTNKKNLSFLIEIVNSGNEKVDIAFDIKTSELSLSSELNEHKIYNKEQNIVNEPLLADGMIPIYYDEFSSHWKKADFDNWYDYKNKKWANAVSVTESSRNSYIKAKANTIIEEDDILAYYVWIPRYKYKLFNVDFVITNPIAIDIKFELSSDEKSSGSSNGEWLTHPAFTLGDEELTGIWVGKFETTGTRKNPTIKPNFISLTHDPVDIQFTISQKFSTQSYVNVNGSTDVDSHITRNMEWGAVVYLSNSINGICNDVECKNLRNNNVNSIPDGKYGATITGCSSISSNGDMVSSNSCESHFSKPYNDLSVGVLASTTHSIYGIYDMNGGNWEATMAVMLSEDNQHIISGYDKYNNSSYDGVLSNGELYKEIELIDLKYLDLYSFNKDSLNFSGSKLGDATGETRGWFDDYSIFISNEKSWFMRSGTYAHGKHDGMFAFGSSVGSFSHIKTFRVALAVFNK